ncbi:MAG: hypothetical protein ABFQ62_05615, partial [Patescibacteria group bacterium]
MPNKKQLISEYGVVEYVRHPLAKIKGLPSIQTGELVKFGQGDYGQVISFDSDFVNVMSFAQSPTKIGDTVTRIDKKLSVDAGPHLLGRVIDPLGQPQFGQDIKKNEDNFRLIDQKPPPLSERRPITNFLRTGTSIVDSILPLAKGQRQIITGDRNTGKSTFAKKLVKTQVNDGNIVIYASISKKMNAVKRIYSYFEKNNLLKNIVMVATYAQDPASLITLTPFTAMTIAEYFRDQGHDVVVILDDLSSHARSYREIALLNRQFPGRDSYPGDIFYLHARILERAGTIKNPQKGNKETISISCLPIAETNNNDLTGYIISNLISITDGHILFDTTLFQQGRRPAINPSLSVTRVGKQTQSPLQRDITRTLTTFLSKYEKAKAMTHFAAELSQESQNMIRRGSHLWAFFTETSDFIIPLEV